MIVQHSKCASQSAPRKSLSSLFGPLQRPGSPPRSVKLWVSTPTTSVCWSDPVNNRLKVLRAENDWSQAELAGRLGVSRQAVNAVETGKHDPSLPLAFKIARLFNMPIEEIFDDAT